jgi:hypothetical protein
MVQIELKHLCNIIINQISRIFLYHNPKKMQQFLQFLEAFIKIFVLQDT